MYQVSNLGRVKGLSFTYTNKITTITLPERYLKPNINKFGYFYVVLHKNKKPKTYKIHRLVALTFIPNLENKKCVDHINTNKLDNRVENLRWVTFKENSNNYVTKKKHRDNIIKSWQNRPRIKTLIQLKKVSKPVICIETQTIYPSINDAGRMLNLDARHICNVCKGKKETEGGYHWKYAE